ncbi:hypothetical protein [Mucilaginibacter myungsuensis]|uniref:Uncharacterized protein n=1 Tax=Mucilaginibacter myungsuensis TaxID=649104 RepID=A0A929KWG2_9SPHI|nr:hypothetical protein [Mucilaginibacter myungsuensis]MBE9661720.1 hypothetical protein [Mucilaginibacter myungsuensis]MDN3597863.1 hypothetical protein [Mucilaginibacter myungsuensis]
MEETELTLEQQIKLAEKEKLIAEANKAKAEKRKLDLEAKELKKQQSKLIYQKKEFWSIFLGTLIAWTAVAFYVIPLAEIHNNQITLDNTKKSDSLYDKERQLKLAYDTLRKRELILIELTNVVNQQRIENSSLKTSRNKVDSTYNALYYTYISEKQINSKTFQITLGKLTTYLDQYKKQKANSDIVTDFSSYTNLSEWSKKADKNIPLGYFAGTSTSTFTSELNGNDFLKKSDLLQSKSQSIFESRVTLRPLYNENIISDLKIKIVAIPSKLGSAGLDFPSWVTNQEVVYSSSNGYAISHLLSGNYKFELDDDRYKIVSTKVNGGLISPGNVTSVFIPFGQETIIDLNLNAIE